MFQPGSYDPRRIDTELGWARSAGLNSGLTTARWPSFTPGPCESYSRYVAVFSRPSQSDQPSGTTLTIDAAYVQERVGGLAKDTDLSRFIL